VSRALGRLDASLRSVTGQGRSSTLEGDIAAAKVHELQQRVPALTRGEGVLSSAFDHHRPIRGEPPSRPRTGRDASNREEYLREVLRRF
jgi:ribosomal protection tetracycline resistance protein